MSFARPNTAAIIPTLAHNGYESEGRIGGATEIADRHTAFWLPYTVFFFWSSDVLY